MPMTEDQINYLKCHAEKPSDEHFTDFEVAGMVRMLMRKQLNHEAVCVLARDRIALLSTKLAEAEKKLAAITK